MLEPLLGVSLYQQPRSLECVKLIQGVKFVFEVLPRPIILLLSSLLYTLATAHVEIW